MGLGRRLYLPREVAVIAPGTTNMVVNLTREEREVFGRLAFAENRSIGSWMRAACMRVLREDDPATYARLIEVRRDRAERDAARRAEVFARARERKRRVHGVTTPREVWAKLTASMDGPHGSPGE